MAEFMVPTRSRIPTTFHRLEEEMRDVMSRFLGPMEWLWIAGNGPFAPPADILETDKGYEILLDLPGIDPKEVNVELREGLLFVSGERKGPKQEKGRDCRSCERLLGRFSRTIPLDLSVDPNKVEATCRDGVLKITVAKKPGAEVRRIEVKT